MQQQEGRWEVKMRLRAALAMMAVPAVLAGEAAVWVLLAGLVTAWVWMRATRQTAWQPQQQQQPPAAPPPQPRLPYQQELRRLLHGGPTGLVSALRALRKGATAAMMGLMVSWTMAWVCEALVPLGPMPVTLLRSLVIVADTAKRMLTTTTMTRVVAAGGIEAQVKPARYRLEA